MNKRNEEMMAPISPQTHSLPKNLIQKTANMPSFANANTLFSSPSSISSTPHKSRHGRSTTAASLSVQRRHIATALTAAMGLQALAPVALAQSWGTHSFMKEKYFSPGLTAEEAVERIKQTAEGLHSIREMLETMSWRYVIFYIRLKSAYLSQDLKTAMAVLPQARQSDFVKTANELVDNMAELDYYVRTPKVYESYLYYEKTLKSIDDLVALLA